MRAVVAVICGLYGLVVGSFLNVVIWRVPRNESIVSPPSHCPECDARIAVRDNIPVFSWVALRGRCRSCATHISMRYPLIEVLTAVLWAAVGVRFYNSWALPNYLLLAAALIALSAIDLEHYILPNRIIYPVGFASVPLLAFASGLEHDWNAFGRACLGAVIGLILVVAGGRGRKQHIPFGPFLAAGTMTFVLFGNQLLDWYRSLGHR